MHREIIESPSTAQSAELLQRFQDFAAQRPSLSDESADKPLLINLRDDDGQLVAGILANAYWDGLEIDTLWRQKSNAAAGWVQICCVALRTTGVVTEPWWPTLKNGGGLRLL